MIQSLGLEHDLQEIQTPSAKPGVERLEQSVEPMQIASDDARVEPQNGNESAQGRSEVATTDSAKPANMSVSNASDSARGAGGLESVVTEEVSLDPLSRVVFHSDPSGLGADRFRYLRMRLRERANAGKLKSLLVTSPMPLDGKSTTALNLATALAERGENAVLLLEADLYHPVVAERLRLRDGPGLAECLVSGMNPISALRRITPLGLYLLPGGRALENPGDLLHGDEFAKVMQILSPHFKWIVIDAPPVAPLADALALARYADASLLVVRAGQTSAEAVETAIESLGAKHVLGVVLNGVQGLARRYAKYNKYYRRSTPL